MKKWICGILSLVLILTSAFALAGARMPAKRGVLTDDADVLGTEVTGAIQEYIDEVEDETGVDLHVVIVHFLDGLDAQTYANQLFAQWKLDDDAVLLLCAAGEDRFATAMGSEAEKELGRQTLDNLMYTSSDFAKYIGTQSYELAFAKYFDALNDLLNKRYDENLKLPRALSKLADGETVTQDSNFWANFTGESGFPLSNLWTETVQGVKDNSDDYTHYHESDEDNGIGVGGWIILLILIGIIFSQSQPVRKARRNYRNEGRRGCNPIGWLFGLVGLGLFNKFRK